MSYNPTHSNNSSTGLPEASNAINGSSHEPPQPTNSQQQQQQGLQQPKILAVRLESSYLRRSQQHASATSRRVETRITRTPTNETKTLRVIATAAEALALRLQPAIGSLQACGRVEKYRAHAALSPLTSQLRSQRFSAKPLKKSGATWPPRAAWLCGGRIALRTPASGRDHAAARRRSARRILDTQAGGVKMKRRVQKLRRRK